MHNQREVDVPSAELDPSAQLSRMRGTPVDALSDSGPLIRPNSGRQVVPRMEPVQPSPGDLSATVPASSALWAAGVMGGAMQSAIGGPVPSVEFYQQARYHRAVPVETDLLRCVRTQKESQPHPDQRNSR